MSQVFQEFADQNLHRVYPLTDESGGVDTSDQFTLPTSLITDIYLCVPNLPVVDKNKFYVSNVLVRKFFIEVTIGYDDPAVTQPLGVFKNISTAAELHTTYDFSPSQIQSGDEFTALYHMTGQITIGDTSEISALLGSWSFSQADDTHSTFISTSRIGKGLLNVQYISVNDRLFTGNVKFREGSNITLDVDTQTVDGEYETVITVSASLNANSLLQLNSDADVLAALISQFGAPILSINGLLPEPEDRNFNIFGLDCTTVDAAANGLVLSNPCASPCCDEDTNLANILDSIANLNLRYAQLKAFLDAQFTSQNTLQNKLLVLGSEV
jgi:hypothetical protein